MNARQLTIDSTAGAIAGHAILITGAARTGTTMMGQLVQSLDSVEYIFEPPTLFPLMALMNQIPDPQWRLLYETYLFEDVLLEALGGRRLNFNPHDDSHIYRAKPEVEIRARLSKSYGRTELVVQSAGSAIAYKVPDMVPRLSRLTDLYPDMVPIVMLRRPDYVIASILRKGWFADHALRSAPAVWPFRQYYGLSIPFWVPEDDIETWARADERERCARYYLYMYEAARPESAMVIDYDAFVAAPAQVFRRLTARLDRSPGRMTQQLLADVAPRAASANVKPENIPTPFFERIDAAWARWAEAALF